jgi:hypothetical protein
MTLRALTAPFVDQVPRIRSMSGREPATHRRLFGALEQPTMHADLGIFAPPSAAQFVVDTRSAVGRGGRMIAA